MNLTSRIGTFAPGGGVVFGGGDENDIRIARIQDETIRINILSPVGAGPSFPAISAIQSDIKSGATRNEDFLGIPRVNERLVNVIEMLRGAVFVTEITHGIELGPIFPRVGAFQQSALFDAGINDIGIAGIKGDELGVRDVWRRRKRPGRSAGHR